MGKFYIKPSLCFTISLKIFNIEYQQNEIPMQAHSTFGLKCSNAIFVPLKKNEYTYFFNFLFQIYMTLCLLQNTNILPEHFCLYRQVLFFSVFLHPEEEQWRVDTYIML